MHTVRDRQTHMQRDTHTEIDIHSERETQTLPPYSNCKKWVKYAYNQHIKHNVNGLAILNVSTGSAYWHDFILNKAEIYYYKGRIKFEINGITQTNPRYDSAFICWRKRKEK